MPIDQYKLSIEARPLRELYSKYNVTSDLPSSQQIVRPLGRVRKKRQANAEDKKDKRKFPHIGDKENDVNQVKKIFDSENKMQKRLDSERDKLSKSKDRRSVSSANTEQREKDNNLFPCLSRSKTQAFEHRYKIAAARLPCNETPSPVLKNSKGVNKKVIHLPLFRINLNTYTGETNEDKTLANTRESLRQLMDLHKSGMKTANVMTANIKNYEFSAPSTSGSIPRSDGSPNAMLLSHPFPAKRAFKSSRGREMDKQSIFVKKPVKFGAYEKEPLENIESDTKSILSEREEVNQDKYLLKTKLDEQYTDDEPDDSMLSVAIRPDTSLTLGSTMHHIDRVIQSPGSDELRELSEVFKSAENQPAWPSYDDVQRLKFRNNSRNQSRNRKSRTSSSRPCTVLEEEDSVTPLPSFRHSHGCSGGHTKPRPVLRYTSKASNYKLDPIIVPSHTCTVCPMCNIYQRDMETPCPPNSPMTSQFSETQMFMESSVQSKAPLIQSARSSRTSNKHDLLHMSRINVSESISSPTDDHLILSYMKANG